MELGSESVSLSRTHTRTQFNFSCYVCTTAKSSSVTTGFGASSGRIRNGNLLPDTNRTNQTKNHHSNLIILLSKELYYVIVIHFLFLLRRILSMPRPRRRPSSPTTTTVKWGQRMREKKSKVLSNFFLSNNRFSVFKNIILRTLSEDDQTGRERTKNRSDTILSTLLLTSLKHRR